MCPSRFSKFLWILVPIVLVGIDVSVAWSQLAGCVTVRRVLTGEVPKTISVTWDADCDPGATLTALEIDMGAGHWMQRTAGLICIPSLDTWSGEGTSQVRIDFDPPLESGETRGSTCIADDLGFYWNSGQSITAYVSCSSGSSVLSAPFDHFYDVVTYKTYKISEATAGCEVIDGTGFTFDGGSSEGWSTLGPFHEDGSGPHPSNFTFQWFDSVDYPGSIGGDPSDGAVGAIGFTTPGGHGIPFDGNVWWINQFHSPDLSNSADWQAARGYYVEIGEDMAASQTLYANLYVRVHDHDLNQDRFFYNGTATALGLGGWSSYYFDWSAISTFPTNYTVLGIFVNIWGTMSGSYAGGVYLDDVLMIPGEADPVPDLDLSTASVDLSAPAAVMLTPEGIAGHEMQTAYSWDGVTRQVVDATVTVTVLDGNGDPIEGLARDRIRLDSLAGSIQSCTDGMIADHDTDANGQTTISGTMLGGGYNGLGETMAVLIDDQPLNQPGLDIHFHGTDINGDRYANLSDLGYFAQDLYQAYQFRSDLVWDGVINLSDVGLFALGFNQVCALMAKPDVATDRAAAGVFFDRDGSESSRSMAAGEEFEVYVLALGEAARAGIVAWQGRIEVSSNLEVLGWSLPEGSVNLRQPPEFAVGIAPEKDRDGEGPVELARVRLRTRDGRSGHVYLSAGLEGADADAAVALATDPSRIVGLRVGDSSDSEGVARVNVPGSAEIPDRQTPTGVRLRNVPNPFNPVTEIRFDLPRAGFAEVRIHDATGRLVRRIEGGAMGAGPNLLVWRGDDDDGSRVASGLYFYRLFLDRRPIGEPRKAQLLK